MISIERDRQIDALGFTTDHDMEHRSGELLLAAVSYINRDSFRWAWKGNNPPKFPIPVSVGDRLRELAKAGALIAAEMDRIIGGGA